jgi:hypothetical protein
MTDIGDFVYSVSYVYGGGPASDTLWTGDGNCKGTVKFGNLVCLIDYLLRGGPPPVLTESGNAKSDGVCCLKKTLAKRRE